MQLYMLSIQYAHSVAMWHLYSKAVGLHTCYMEAYCSTNMIVGQAKFSHAVMK